MNDIDFEVVQSNAYETLRAIYDDARTLTAESYLAAKRVLEAETEESIDYAIQEYFKALRYTKLSRRVSVDTTGLCRH